MEGNSLGELGSIISKLSENPEMLSAIGSLMGMLSQPKKAQEQKPSDVGLFDLLGSLGGGEKAKPKEESAVSRIFGTKEEQKNRIALLNAVKPYLSEERRDRLDTAIKLLKLTELGELGALLANS